MAVDIRLACQKVIEEDESMLSKKQKICTPGDVILPAIGNYMSGHGTFLQEDTMHASVAGIVEQTNKLISVKPLKTRYNGEIGDCVVGRITDIQQKCWKVDTNSRLDSVLLLSSVNLPTGELRRRSVEDRLMMRQYLQEGDLISAEVKEILADKTTLSLHTRSIKYGKLSQGTLARVSPSLIKRSKTHFHTFDFGVSVILGNNGLVWVSPNVSEVTHSEETSQNAEVINKADREAVARVRNCILALASKKYLLYDTSIAYAYEESLKYENAKDLLKPEVIDDIVDLMRKRIEIEIDD